MNDTFFKERVAAVQETISRSRVVFLILNLATIIILIGAYNLYFSWIRFAVPRKVTPDYTSVLEAVAKARVVDTAMMSVPVVGLRIFAGDLGIISALGMFVLAVWLHFAFRKEQHSVASMVLDLTRPSPDPAKGFEVLPDAHEEARFARAAFSSRFLFITTDRRGPIRDRDPRVVRGSFTLGGVANALLWAPVWTVGLCWLLDIRSLFMTSALFSPPGMPGRSVFEAIKDLGGNVDALVRLALALLTGIVIAIIMAGVAEYHLWTGVMYRRLDEAVEALDQPLTGSHQEQQRDVA